MQNLTNEQLVERIQTGDKSLMGELYTKNKGIILKIARNICRENQDEFEEAMQDAYFGLVVAVEGFDCNSEYKFTTYAAHCVRGAIIRAREGRTGIPYHLLWKYQKIKQTKEALTNKLGRVPTKQEISDGTGLSIKQIEAIRTITMPPHSLYEQIGDDGFTLGDVIKDNGIDFENETADADERRFVHDVIEELPEREREALKLHYFYRMTYAQVGRQLHVSGNYARELICKGVKRLQSPQIKRKFLDDTLDSVTAFHRHRGIQAFNNTWTSATEKAVLDRERYKERLESSI